MTAAKTLRALGRLLALTLLLWPATSELGFAQDAGVQDAGALEQQAPEGHEPNVEVSLEPRDGVNVGETVKLSLVATVPKGDEVTLPEQGFASMEVLAKNRKADAPQGDTQTFRFALDLLGFEAGDIELDHIRLRIVTQDGAVFEAIAPKTIVHLKSTIGNEPNAQLKPESKPVVVMEDDYTLAYIGLGILGALLVAGLTLLLQRYMASRVRPEPPPPPPRPPWEIAVEELAELRKRKQAMIEAGQAVEFVDRVSDVVRNYLGRCFGFAGLDTTTAELLDELRTRRAPSGLQVESRDYLGRCDLVKFAKVTPDQDEVDLILAKAQDIVQFSMPTHAEDAQPDGTSQEEQP